MRCDFASAKPRENLSRIFVAARAITVHSSRPYGGQLGTVCRLLSRVAPPENMRPSDVSCLMSDDGCAGSHTHVGQLSRSCEVERLAYRTARTCTPRYVSTSAGCPYAGPWASTAGPRAHDGPFQP